MSVCSEVGISVQVLPRTIVSIVYSVYRHVRVCKVVDVCEVSIYGCDSLCHVHVHDPHSNPNIVNIHCHVRVDRKCLF